MAPDPVTATGAVLALARGREAFAGRGSPDAAAALARATLEQIDTGTRTRTVGLSAWAAVEVASTFHERSFWLLRERLLGARDQATAGAGPLEYACAVIAAVRADRLANTWEFADRLAVRLLPGQRPDGLFGRRLASSGHQRPAPVSTQLAVAFALGELAQLTGQAEMRAAAVRCLAETIRRAGPDSRRHRLPVAGHPRLRARSFDTTIGMPFVTGRLAQPTGSDPWADVEVPTGALPMGALPNGALPTGTATGPPTGPPDGWAATTSGLPFGEPRHRLRTLRRWAWAVYADLRPLHSAGRPSWSSSSGTDPTTRSTHSRGKPTP